VLFWSQAWHPPGKLHTNKHHVVLHIFANRNIEETVMPCSKITRKQNVDSPVLCHCKIAVLTNSLNLDGKFSLSDLYHSRLPGKRYGPAPRQISQVQSRRSSHSLRQLMLAIATPELLRSNCRKKGWYINFSGNYFLGNYCNNCNTC
jgi:hypothetical protein